MRPTAAPNSREPERVMESAVVDLALIGACHCQAGMSDHRPAGGAAALKGVFEGVARGLGCAPGSPFLCLASSPPPSAWPARAKSHLSTWLPWYAIFHRSVRARLSAALGGRFSGALRRRWVALAGSRGRRETSSRPSPSRKP
jgi:hypothetical protein